MRGLNADYRSALGGGSGSSDWSAITNNPFETSDPTDFLSAATDSTQDIYGGDLYLRDDTTPSHYLRLTAAENLTANRTLSLALGDADRTLTLNGNVTLGATTSGLTAIAGTNSLTSAAGQALVLATGTTGTALTIASATNAVTLSQGALNFTGATTITGGAGNMTIVSGTGNSRTMILQTTTSGSTPTTVVTFGADQSSTFAGNVKMSAGTLSANGAIIGRENGQASALLSNDVAIPGTTGKIFFTDSNLYNVTADLYMSRSAAATLHLGNFDAASPVAQTLGAQGSRAGTDSNVAGANLTIRSGRGTGNSTGSSLILQTPTSTSSGTGAQTSATRLTLTETLATFTVAGIFPAATTSLTSIRLPHGSAPSSPVDGDIWTTTAGIFVRINGSTVGPLS